MSKYNSLMHIKKILLTGLSFSIFGVFASLMAGFLLPFCILFSSNNLKSQQRFRRIISGSFRLFIKIISFLGLIKINVTSLDAVKQAKGALVICNHPSLLDVVIIISYLDSIQCVVKSSLWKNPFIGLIVRGCGYIRNNSDPEILLDNFQKCLENGENILIFPEGTRSIPGEKIKLQRGVGNMALFMNANIQMLTMKCSPPALLKGDKWYNIPTETPVFVLDTGPLIDINNFHVDVPRPKRVRMLMREIETFYNGFLGYE